MLSTQRYACISLFLLSPRQRSSIVYSRVQFADKCGYLRVCVFARKVNDDDDDDELPHGKAILKV